MCIATSLEQRHIHSYLKCLLWCTSLLALDMQPLMPIWTGQGEWSVELDVSWDVAKCEWRELYMLVGGRLCMRDWIWCMDN